MDQQQLLEIADYVTKLKLYPYFDIAHYAVMCLIVRDDSNVPEHSGPSAFSRRHPLACWIASMLMCFAGSIIGNFLVGESIVMPFKNNNDIILASAVWYAIYYSPFDIVYKLCRFAPVHLILRAGEQLHVAHKVHHGVNFALKHYTGAYVIAVIIGVVKGSGHCFMQLFERLVRGVWLPSANDLLHPSFEVKSCLVATVMLILQMRGFLSVPFSIVYFGVVLFLVYFDIAAQVIGTHDPFVPLENIICAVFFGGLVDKVRKVTTGGGTSRLSAGDDDKKLN